MVRNKMSGFTLIELMVVIVIIGVLASLAIPRFSEASSKAKMGEAPRIIASFESGFLASMAEGAEITDAKEMTISVPEESNWFTYTATVDTKAGTGSLKAVAKKDMGKFVKSSKLGTEYVGSDKDKKVDFEHCADLLDGVTKKLVPNFVTDDMAACK